MQHHFHLSDKVDCVWNVMAHAQKPDFVFQRNRRVHLNWRRRQFSRLLAAEVCASAVVMLDTPCSEVVWRVLATHFIHQFPLHFPSRASPCAIRFQLDSTYVSEKLTAHIFRLEVFHTLIGPECSSETLLLSYKTTWCHNPAECSKNLHHLLRLRSSGLGRCVIWWTVITFKGTGCFHLLGIRVHGITAQMPIILIFTTVRNRSLG